MWEVEAQGFLKGLVLKFGIEVLAAVIYSDIHIDLSYIIQFLPYEDTDLRSQLIISIRNTWTKS